MKNKEGLSLIVPIYNEVLGINASLVIFEKLQKKCHFSFEIILVDDASHDGTTKILNSFFKKKIKNKSFKLIQHKFNFGYGGAIKSGVKVASYDFIAITDADNTYPNDRLIEFYKEIISEKYDMIVGSRVGKNVKIPLIRRPAKYVINVIANYLSNTKIPDLNSGMRIFKKNIFLKYINILPNGFSLTTTITLAMLTNGYSVHYKKDKLFS